MPFKIISKSKYKKMQDNYKKMEIESLKKKADISLLQSQINPHFLYNSLESIRGLAVIKNVPEIADIAESLANFFRYSIDAKNDVISLRQELESVKNYMSIQKYRFGNRYTLLINNDLNEEMLSNIQLPKLILQPIVENSIIHAFQNMSSNCKIIIDLQQFDKLLKLNIKDNGKGMDIAQLTLINQLINQEITDEEIQSGKSLGIALRNVRKRIQLFFGSEASFSIKSMENIGTDVEMFIPIKLDQGEVWEL